MKLVSDAIRLLFGFFDSIVYAVVTWALQLIFDLANTEIFTQSVINEFAKRIYVILGLVMVFKVILSFLQILINPDTFGEKEKGVGGVLKRVIITLLLIVFVPSIFRVARQAQQYIMPIIPKVLLGVSDNNGISTEDIGKIGDNIAWYSFLPFFQYDNEACSYGGELTGLQMNESDLIDPNVEPIIRVKDALDHVNDTDACSNHKYKYKYDYKLGLSTFVGAYLIYVLVNVAVKIAVRTIKFGICEFAAPIPIASYIDPKKSKETFDKWVSTSVKIYLELYVHLITVYFVMMVFLIFCEEENLSIIYANLGGDTWRSTLVTLFVITGLLKFAKDAPKFITDMLGLKGDSFGSIFKPDGWKALGSTLVTAAAPIATGVANFTHEIKDNHSSIGAALRSAAAGASSTAFHGGIAAIQGKGAKEILAAGHTRSIKKRQTREFDALNHVNSVDRAKVMWNDFMGWNSESSLFKEKLDAAEKVHGNVSNLKANYNKAFEKYANNISLKNSDQQAFKNFKDIIKQNSVNIQNGNSIELKEILQKIQDPTREHEITYGDILTARLAASQSGSGGADIGRRLSDNAEEMKGIQKKLWNSSMRGEIKDTTGGVVKKLDARVDSSGNFVEKNLDSDLQIGISQIKNDITSNIAALSNETFGNDPNELYKNFIQKGIGWFDDELQNTIIYQKGNVGTSKENLARESIQRHKSDNK